MTPNLAPIIAAYEARQAAAKAAAEETHRREADRIAANAATLEAILRSTVLPAMESAAAQLRSAGYPAAVEIITPAPVPGGYHSGGGLTFRASPQPGTSPGNLHRIEYRAQPDAMTLSITTIKDGAIATAEENIPASTLTTPAEAHRIETFATLIF